MAMFIKKLLIKPAQVSWFSFIFLGVIVFGVGMFGTASITNYLQNQLTLHEIKQSQNIASALCSKFNESFKMALQDSESVLSHTLEDYQSFGYRFVILDELEQSIYFDSEQRLEVPILVSDTWIAQVKTKDSESIKRFHSDISAFGLDDANKPALIWFQDINITDSPRWVLGVIKDRTVLSELKQDLHHYLDMVMLIIFILITLLGYIVMRSIGRIYENKLEKQLEERTVELNIAHTNALQSTKFVTIGKTATVLAHEMRNPLASIKLALSGLNNSESLNEREQRRIALVQGEVDRLDKLLSVTLDYAKPVELSTKPVNLDRLLSKVLQQEEPIFQQKSVKLKNIACTECTAIRVDQGQFHQVFLNLVKNALEESPKGGLIETSLMHEKNRIVFEISNEGEPLSDEVLENAFDPFFTTKSKGTGLGLGLVKRVVDAHRGSVSIKNEDGSKIKVTIIVPF